ncbi:hypothetical protein VF21_03763 [Pseudogymnoascus sp. 05NY08]|nr:hypothetical protein VF21_03763 [Pseudogymnoascus sp. 05NY08]
MWREDEKANGIGKVDLKNAKLKVEGQADATTKKFKGLRFSIWRLNSNPDFINNLPPAINVETRTYYEKTPPHLYFTKAHAFQAWEMLREETEPAEYKWILPSDDRLLLLSPTKESEELLSQFYNM